MGLNPWGKKIGDLDQERERVEGPAAAEQHVPVAGGVADLARLGAEE